MTDHRIRFVSFILAMVVLFCSTPLVGVNAEDTLSLDVNCPFTSSVKFNVNNVETSSNSYRIPSMVTLKDGTIVAAADIRWNTTFDGGGLDTLVAYSKDGGVTWNHSVANYLGDNGNSYSGSSTCFIDPCLTVAADGQTVYMLVDLYPYGVALNGNKETPPSKLVGFDDNGNLILRDSESGGTNSENRGSYTYYLKDGYIYNSNNGKAVTGYRVDEYFNVYENDTLVSNLFYSDSRFKVVRTGYLYLISSDDDGQSWSAPTLLNLKRSSEQVCLVGPGRGLTTSDGTMVFPVYSYNGSTESQRMGFIYLDKDGNWNRIDSSVNWSSEAAVVEVGEGVLRFFYRNGTASLCYIDYNMNNGSWGTFLNTGISVNSNTQLSAITYSKTVNGNQVILISCPTGPKAAGSDNNNGGYRLNGRIFAGIVQSDGTMTWKEVINVSGTTAQNADTTAPYTEAEGFFAYSCLTERSDGSIAILYENKENAWGTGDNCYYAMNMKAYSVSELGLNFDSETTEPDVPPTDETKEIVSLMLGETSEIITVNDKEHIGTEGTFITPDGTVSYTVKHGTSAYHQDSLATNNGTTVNLCSALYTFTGSNTAGWIIQNGDTYLGIDSGRAPGYPGGTTSELLTLQKSQYTTYGSDAFNIKNVSSERYLYFHRDSKKRFDRQGSAAKETAFFIYAPIGETGTSSTELPGYYKITDVSQIVSGNKYLIVAYSGAYYVLYPSISSSDYYAHVATASGTATTCVDQKASTTITFTGLSVTSATDVTIGDKTYTVVVETYNTQIHTNLYPNSNQTLDALVDLGLSGNDYSVTYTKTEDTNNVITLNGNTITSLDRNGLSTVIATVTNAAGVTVGTVTYTITVSDIVITDFKNIYVPEGGTAIIEGLTGDIHTDVFAESIATYSVGSKQTITFTGIAVGRTALVVGETQINVYVNPKNTGSGANTQKYVYICIEEIKHCKVYCSINGSDLIEIKEKGVLIDQSYTDGIALILFAAPENGYALTQMLGSDVYVNNSSNPKPIGGDFFALRNGKNADGEVDITLGDAWPLNADGSYKAHGWQWMLKEGNISKERLKEIMEAAAELGCDGASVITRNGNTGTTANTEEDMDWDDVAVNYSFVAETLPTFDKTIVSVNGQPYNEDVHIEFGSEIMYRFTITSYSEGVSYTDVTIEDDLIGFVHSVSADRLNTPGSYSVTATYTVKLSDLDKYVGGKFHNKAHLTYDYSSKYYAGKYEFTDSATVSCDINGMVYYTWADNVPDGITGNVDLYPLPEQAVVIYGTQFQVKPYSGTREYVAMENGVAVGKWLFQGWRLEAAEYTGGETVTMVANGSLAFVGIWEYTPYPTYTVQYEWTNAPHGAVLPVDNVQYYQGQIYTVDGFYFSGIQIDYGTSIWTFSGWTLDGELVSGENVMQNANVLLIGAWTAASKYTSLTIQTDGYSEYTEIDSNQVFIFQVVGENVDLTVVAHGNEPITIMGLSVDDTYSVTILSSWSWRYNATSWTYVNTENGEEKGTTQTAQITVGAGGGTITFTNSRNNSYWLGNDSWCNNIFR